MTEYQLPQGYKLVHQGGHHDVYCDGLTHIRTSGGFTGISLPRLFKGKEFCDCQRYQQGGDMYVESN